MDNVDIGKRLQDVRESLGFTQEQVAKYIGTSRESISYIETGARPITTLVLGKLANIYGYKLSHFLDDTIQENRPYVTMAFRIKDLGDNDLATVSKVNRIAMNLDNLYKLLGV